MKLMGVVRAVAALLLIAAIVFAAVVAVGIFTALDSATAAYATGGFFAAG